MTSLPRYTDDEPFLGATDDKKAPYIVIDESHERLMVGGGPEPTSCFGKWRARTKARWAERRLNRCDNSRCNKKRKVWRFIMFSFFTVAMFSFARMGYLWYNLPKNIHCVELAPNMELDLTLGPAKSIWVHHSLTSGSSSIVHSDDIKPGSYKVKLEFEDDGESKKRVTDGDNDDDDEPEAKKLVCWANLKKVSGLGAFAKEKDVTLPAIKSTTIYVAKEDKYPNVNFSGKFKKSNCHEGFIRNAINRRPEGN